MAVDPGLMTLAGVVVGGALSWAGLAWNERVRFQRDQTTRLQEQRMSAYADFSAAAKATMSVLFRVGAGLGVDPMTEPLSMEDARPLLASAFHEREAAFERTRLVATEPVVQAARQWVRGMYEMRQALERGDLDAVQWSELVTAANEGRNEFFQAAKRELGVPDS